MKEANSIKKYDSAMGISAAEGIRAQFRANQHIEDKNVVAVLIRDAYDHLKQFEALHTNLSTWKKRKKSSGLNSNPSKTDVLGREGRMFPWQRK